MRATRSVVRDLTKIDMQVRYTFQYYAAFSNANTNICTSYNNII